VRHVARLALGEELAEHLGRVAAVALLDEEAREVRARHQLRVAHVTQRAFVGALDADLREAVGHFMRARITAAAHGEQPAIHRFVVGVEAEPDDMHRAAGERHGNLRAREVFHAVRVRRFHRAALAGDLVMVGEGPQLHPVRGRPGRELFGGQRAVVGDHVVFGAGQFRPGSDAGRRLLAHELTHVVQQNQGLRNIQNDSKRIVPAAEAAPRHVNASTAQQTVQRLVGFEAEFSVPTYKQPESGLTDENILYAFFKGGYDQPFRSVGEVSGLYDIIPDVSGFNTHASALRASLGPFLNHKSQQMFNKFKELKLGVTKLEYRTKAIDEIGSGSTQTFEAQFSAIKNHADGVLATVHKGSTIVQQPASGMMTGIPMKQIDDLINASGLPEIQQVQDSRQKVKEKLENYKNEVKDELDIQATVGILPSEIPSLWQEERDKHRQSETVVGGGRDSSWTGIQREAANCIISIVQKLMSNEELTRYIEQNHISDVRKQALEGLMYTIVSYLVGDALSQTTLFDKMDVKNAVPYLSKLNLSNWNQAMPLGRLSKAQAPSHAEEREKQGKEEETGTLGIPQQLVETLAQELGEREEFGSSWWKKTMQLTPKDRGRDRLVIDTPHAFAYNALMGIPVKTRLNQVGAAAGAAGSEKEFKSPDTMPKAVSEASEGQSGVQLEYRRLNLRTSAAGLGAELMGLVKQFRERTLKN